MTMRPVRPRALSLFALPGIPMVRPGDDLAVLIQDGFARAGEAAAAGPGRSRGSRFPASIPSAGSAPCGARVFSAGSWPVGAGAPHGFSSRRL